MTQQLITTIVMGLLGLILVPLAIADFRFRQRVSRELGKLNDWREFMQTFILKNVTLDFHSNPNPDDAATDAIIEKVGKEKLTEDDVEKLKAKLATVKDGEDSKKALKAGNALELLQFIEDFERNVEARGDARNRLFNE